MHIEERLVSVRPSQRQIDVQKMEMYAFIHFGINTFTDREWGVPDSDISIFNPENLDTAQWVAAVKSAGMGGVILTCKHHDGFCLWNTRQTDYQVMNTPCGRDITLELSQECARQGIRFGVYLSPWDMHEPRYGTGKAYDDFYVAQLTELLTTYGKVFTVWLDGACGEGANGKVQRYDWTRYYETVRRLQPDAAIAVTGPDIRWCGNEAGICRESEFSVVPARLREPDVIAGNSQQTENDALRLRKISRQDADLGSRTVLEHEADLIWYPAEVDTSIRPNWFYHTEDDEKVKSDETLWQLYCSSVGGNATLLLNIPPDKSGRFHPTDCRRLENLGKRIRSVFAQNLTETAHICAADEEPEHPATNVIVNDEHYYKAASRSVQLTLTWDAPVTFAYVMLMEQITQGQRMEAFELWANDCCIFKGTTVGYKKICHFTPVTSDCLTLRIQRSRCAPTLRFWGVYGA